MNKANKLAEAVAKARATAFKGIQNKFKNKPFERIVIDKRRKLRIGGNFGGDHIVREVRKNGEVHCWNIPNSVTVLRLEKMSTEGIIAILAELEQMELHNQLKKS